ncbi:MAG: tetratricopeptide repeat protein [Pseudomonadota bacterium]
MTSDNRTLAATQCARGISQAVRNQADAMAHINAAITADENYCLAHLIKAWMLQGANDQQYSPQVAAETQLAKELLPEGNGVESGLLAALEPMQKGRRDKGVAMLAALCEQHPTDAYLQLLAQEHAFWLGDANRMRTVVETAAPHWTPTHADYGPFLSLRSFANEEAGDYLAAERYGREAVEIDSSDVWGAHSVAHVLLMKGQIKQGIDWLDNLSVHWQNANQMQHHLWWHYCLFLFETGEHDRIVELLHTKIRDPQSELIKAAPAATIDNNNYASLLMRLELYGVDVSRLWQTLAEICASRTANHASVFSNIHDMMVLTATGQSEQANRLLASMAERFANTTDTSSLACAYRQVGIPVCKAIKAHRQQNYNAVIELLGSIRHQLHYMGASPAQRDVFFHLLVYAARKENRAELIRDYLADIEQLGFCDVANRAAYRLG